MIAIEVLKQARELISQPHRWTKCAFARSKDKRVTSPLAHDAYCFCALGAVARIDHWNKNGHIEACKALDLVVRGKYKGKFETVAVFNDQTETTHEMVLEVFDEAIAMLDGQNLSGVDMYSPEEIVKQYKAEDLRVLRQARELISEPQHWTKLATALNDKEEPAGTFDKDTVAWSMFGAIEHYSLIPYVKSRVYGALHWSMRDKYGDKYKTIYHFHHHEDTTHAMVLDLIDAAIAKRENEP